MEIKIHDAIKTSLVNGAGIRYTIFFQGCPHHCVGCQNPFTWDINGGKLADINELVKDIVERKPFIDGVTYSGGDPLAQYEKLLELSKLLKEHNVNIWVWTGFKFDEIKEKFNDILNYVDVIVDGKYEKDNPTTKPYRGSNNQVMWTKKDNNWTSDEVKE